MARASIFGAFWPLGLAETPRTSQTSLIPGWNIRQSQAEVPRQLDSRTQLKQDTRTMSAQPEVWRVSTVEGVFETDLETLKQWISEGCVLPTDKVCKGSHNWIEAGRAPMLKAVFAGDYTPPPPPPTSPPAYDWQTPRQYEEPAPSDTSGHWGDAEGVGSSNSAANDARACTNHPELAPFYVCRVCNATWCETCPRFVSGSKIPLCPSCGDLCKLYHEVTATVARSQFQASGFGIADFVQAIRYPFQHKLALVLGALIYALLLMADFGGGIGIRRGGGAGGFIAWMIMFGCMSHVISQVAWGRLHRSFMPDFSSFSMWDDVIQPVLLGVGITIVTWGPIIALVIALFLGVMSGPGLPSVVPGQEMSAAAESSGPTPEDLDVLTDPNADPKKLEEANRKLNQIRPGAQIAQEAERSKQENDPAALGQMLMPYLGAGSLLLVLFLLGLAWAFFYYPMALTVAGYTQSFGSVVNPLVGLDTIRRMGSTYFKAFGMVLVVEVVAFVVGVIIALITSPFNLPFVGNLPGNFINATATFYFNLVIACLLGLSLYKSADRLGISVD
jgi:Protein of unknown function (DUF4013)